MTILREKRERIVIDEHPVAVCDGCGKRVEVTDIDLGYAQHPSDWLRVWDPKGFCSVACLAAYGQA